MSILPVQTYSNNSSAIYKSSNDAGPEGGGLSICVGTLSSNANLGPNVGSAVPVGYVGLFNRSFTANAKGWIKFNLKSGDTSATGNLYLSTSAYPDVSQNYTYLSLTITDGTIVNLDGLTYSSESEGTTGFNWLTLAFITTGNNLASTWSVSSVTGSVPYSTQYTNSSWTMVAGGAWGVLTQ